MSDDISADLRAVYLGLRQIRKGYALTNSLDTSKADELLADLEKAITAIEAHPGAPSAKSIDDAVAAQQAADQDAFETAIGAVRDKFSHLAKSINVALSLPEPPAPAAAVQPAETTSGGAA